MDKSNLLLIKGILDGTRAYVGPSLVQIDLTNDCDNSCLGCWVHSPLLGKAKMGPEERKIKLSLKTVKKLIDDLHEMGTKEIQLSGAGEPFMYPKVIEILEYIKKRRLRCNVITDFALIDEAIAKRLVELEVDYLTVSLWAGNAETYARLHPNKSRDTFLRIGKMLKFIHSLKAKQNKSLPKLKIYNVICNLNCHEIEEMLDFALETKVEFLEFQVVDIVPGKTDSLSLIADDRRSLMGQFQRLKMRIDCPHEVRERLADFENEEHNLEFEEFGRFLERMPVKKSEHEFDPQWGMTEEGRKFSTNNFAFFSWKEKKKGKIYICRTLTCPAGKTTDNPKIIEEENKFIFKFDPSQCFDCHLSDKCLPEGGREVVVRYLSLLGFGSFSRRIANLGTSFGQYDSSIVDTIPCYSGWIYARVLSNGDVIPCCKAHRLPVGNIYEDDFRRIWNFHRQNQFRYKAKHFKKSDSYFSKIECYKSCDNLGMNLETYKEILNLSILDKTRLFFKRTR